MRSNSKLYLGVAVGVVFILILVFKISNSDKDVSENEVFVGSDEKWRACRSTFDRNTIEDQKTLFIVTPTYSRQI